MTLVHRATDLRTCGAVTVPLGPKRVYVNGLAISTTGDLNSHGGGALVGTRNVWSEGKQVVGVGDPGAPDSAVPPHSSTNAAMGSPTVHIG